MWRFQAAAALGINRQELPASTYDLKGLLLEASIAYPLQLLAAAQAAGYQFSSQSLAFLLATSVKTSRPAAVSAILEAMPATTWMVRVLQEPLALAAEQGNIKAFQLLVKAGVAAEEAAAEAADGSNPGVEAARRGGMKAFRYTLQCAVKANKPALVKWVLKEGQLLWTPALLKPFISAAIAAAAATSLQYLLASCSTAWPPQELLGYLAPALAHPDKDAKALVLVLLNAAAASGQQWTAAQLNQALLLAAQQGKVGALRSLLQHSGVAWTHQQLLPAIMGVAKGPKEPFHSSLKVQLPFQVEMMEALLAAAADEWTAGELEPALTATARRAKGDVLEQQVLAAILQHPGTMWSVEALLPALEVITGRCLERSSHGYQPERSDYDVSRYSRYWSLPARSRHSFKEMVADLLAAAEGQWTEQQLAGSVALATKEKNVGVLKVLLHQIPRGWRGEHLLAAVELAAKGASDDYFQAAKGTSDDYFQAFETILSILLKAASGSWTAKMLADALGDAAICCTPAAVKELLELEGVQWTAVSLHCAMVKAAGSDKLEALELILPMPSVDWQVGRVQTVLAAAAKTCSWSCFYKLLQSPAAACLSSADLQQLVDLIVKPSVSYLQYLDCPLFHAGYKEYNGCVKVRCLVLLKVLVHPNHGGLIGLTGTLAVAAAAGNKELLAQLLGQQGLEWTKAQLQPAVRVAVRGCQWEVMEQLLAVPERGWSSRDLLPLLQGALEGANSEGVRKLLNIPESVLLGGWSAEDKLSAVIQAAEQTILTPEGADILQCVGQVLAASVNAGWSAHELQEVLTLAAACHEPPWAFVQQLLEFPTAAWRGRHMHRAAISIACTSPAKCPWDVLRWMLRVEDAEWTVEQLGRVLEELLGTAGSYLHFVGREQTVEPLTKVVSEIRAVSGIEWKGVQLATAAEKAAVHVEFWGVLELLLVIEGAEWTGEQLGRVLKNLIWAAGCDPSMSSVIRQVQHLEIVRKVVSEILAVSGIVWKGVHLANAAELAARRSELEGVLELLMMIEGAEWTGEQLLPVMKAVVEAAEWAEQLPLVLCAGEDVQWEAQDLVDALKKAVAAEKWVLAEQLVAAGSTGGWDVLQLAEAIEVAARQGQMLLVEQLLAAPSVGWTVAVLRVAMEAGGEKQQWRVLRQLLVAAGRVQGWGLEDLRGVMVAVVEAGQEHLVQLVLGVAAASGDVTWQGGDLDELVAAAQSRGHWGVLRHMLRAAAAAVGGEGWAEAVVWTEAQVLELLNTASSAGVVWLVGMLLDGTRAWLTRAQLVTAVTAAAGAGSGSSSVLQLLLQQAQWWSLAELEEAVTVAAQVGDVRGLQMLVSAMGLIMMGVHWQPGHAAGMMG